MGGKVKNIIKSPTRLGTAIVTAGGSELARLNPAVDKGLGMADKGLDYGVFGKRQTEGSFLSAPSGQNPIQLLAQTGGAPILANIAMGVNVEETLAGYLGTSVAELRHAIDSNEPYLGNKLLSADEVNALRSVRTQLSTIQSNKELRDKAVSQVIADFPNVAKNAAQARASAGGEFDEVTKGYMQQALQGTAAKFAAGGNLSSGAANEAFARVGAEQGMRKLDFMGQREEYAYNTGANEFNARLSEVNALRDFQNTMLTGQVSQGFSAQQANLQRQFQGQAMNAEMANQRYLADQQSKNAMFGAVGGLAGTFLAAKTGGLFGGTGGLFGSTAPKITTPKFGGGGYGSGPGIDTSGYAPGNQYRGY